MRTIAKLGIIIASSSLSSPSTTAWRRGPRRIVFDCGVGHVGLFFDDCMEAWATRRLHGGVGHVGLFFDDCMVRRGPRGIVLLVFSLATRIHPDRTDRPDYCMIFCPQGYRVIRVVHELGGLHKWNRGEGQRPGPGVEAGAVAGPGARREGHVFNWAAAGRDARWHCELNIKAFVARGAPSSTRTGGAPGSGIGAVLARCSARSSARCSARSRVVVWGTFFIVTKYRNVSSMSSEDYWNRNGVVHELGGLTRKNRKTD